MIHYAPDGRRHTVFFADVDCVKWFYVANGSPTGPSRVVLDWYADNDHRRPKR